MSEIKKDGSSLNKPSTKIKGITIDLTIRDIPPELAKNESQKN